MINRAKYAPCPASPAQFCQWSAHVDSLERHLSANRWAVAAVVAVLIAYPITRIVTPIMLHGMVPDAVRNVLNFL